MAGVGFALRSHLRQESYTDLIRVYLIAALIGSGPWIVSIGSMLLISLWGVGFASDPESVTRFLATVTHLMAMSLIFSGALQLLFTRFVADRLFEKNVHLVVPNLFGALCLTTIASGTVASLAVIFLFDGDLLFRAFVVASFVALCNIWILTVLLSGMKAYWSVLLFFLLGYTVTVLSAPALGRFGQAGYLAGFCFGHWGMFFGMLTLILREYPADTFMAFDFLNRKKIFLELALTGLVFNAAIWIDKFIFWWNPVTSESLIGPIRYSVVYDVPVFVAYLSVIPGMAVFFVRIETDFAEQFDLFYTAVREGGTLTELKRLQNALVRAARAGIHDIFRIQGLAVLVLLFAGGKVLELFRIPPFYLYLFRIDVVAVSFQVILLGIFTILFYLDYRKLVLYLALFFLLTNGSFSLASLELGPRFYGFGFALSAALTSLLSLGFLSRRLDRLGYETFMR